MKQQTAVEWYNDEVNQLVSMLITNQLSISRYSELQNKLLEQAKAMDKKQMQDSWLDGFVNLDAYRTFEQYYNETYGK